MKRVAAVLLAILGAPALGQTSDSFEVDPDRYLISTTPAGRVVFGFQDTLSTLSGNDVVACADELDQTMLLLSTQSNRPLAVALTARYADAISVFFRYRDPTTQEIQDFGLDDECIVAEVSTGFVVN